MKNYAEIVGDAVAAHGPLRAYERLLAENDALIASASLDNGRRIVSERTALHTSLVAHWAQAQHEAASYSGGFAVVALGGTGRGEMTPFSDTDFAFLFDEALEGNELLLELQRQIIQTDSFAAQYGFTCAAFPFSLVEVPRLEGKQLNSFLDMRPVYDPHGLSEAFRARISDTYDPFEHFLHVRRFWQQDWEAASFRSEELDRFDIKNDGLRVFLAGIWTLAGRAFCHSQEIYDSLDDPRDLEAYEFLLRIRAFIHSRRSSPVGPAVLGNHPEDVLGYDDFIALGELAGPNADEATRFRWGNEIRARLLAARRRIAIFTRGVIRQELQRGRIANKSGTLVFGLGGLSALPQGYSPTAFEKSEAAIALLQFSQRYGVPVDPKGLMDTFRNAGDWLEVTPRLASLFYESSGSLADSFKFLSQLSGAEDRLFPGYSAFEVSIDRRVRTEKKSLRGKLQRPKFRALDRYLRLGRELQDETASASEALPSELEVARVAALLDADSVAAIKLALKTKRLPLTEEDRAAQADETRDLYQRYASGFSGIPLEDYFTPFVEKAGFPEDCIELTIFLIANRRAFKTFAGDGISDQETVDALVQRCGSEDRLRALYVFTRADRVDWEAEADLPDLWFSINELYEKALQRYEPSVDPDSRLKSAGFSLDERIVLGDFGRDFFGGRYAKRVDKFGSHLLRLAEDSEYDEPKISLFRDGASMILGLATRDFRGLAATVSGEFRANGIEILQAHFFSSSRFGLALNFFHFELAGAPLSRHFGKRVYDAVVNRSHLECGDEEMVGSLDGNTTFKEWRDNQFCLSFEGSHSDGSLLYSLCLKMYLHLKADIFALKAHSTQTRSFVSIYHSLPEEVSPETARRHVNEYF